MTLARNILKGIVRGYQLLISPVLPGICRFEPTCSEYAMQSIGRFGAGKGLWLSVKRLVRCQPWGDSGYDPVPDHHHATAKEQQNSCPAHSRSA